MKLIDPETNQEYEFEKDNIADIDITKIFTENLGTIGTLKPVDSWPKVQSSYYYYDNSGEVYEDEWEGYEVDQKRKEQGNCFRTKQEAEYAAERIRSLQEAKVVMGLVIGEEVSATLILPKKYLKAWRELQDE